MHNFVAIKCFLDKCRNKAKRRNLKKGQIMHAWFARNIRLTDWWNLLTFLLEFIWQCLFIKPMLFEYTYTIVLKSQLSCICLFSHLPDLSYQVQYALNQYTFIPTSVCGHYKTRIRVHYVHMWSVVKVCVTWVTYDHDKFYVCLISLFQRKILSIFIYLFFKIYIKVV